MLLYNYRVGNLEFLWEVSTMYITIKTITDGVEAYNIIKDSELEALFKCCPKAVVRTWVKQDDCDFIIMDGKLLCAYYMKGTTLLPYHFGGKMWHDADYRWGDKRKDYSFKRLKELESKPCFIHDHGMPRTGGYRNYGSWLE